MPSPGGLSSGDWLDACRRAAGAARAAVERYPTTAERSVETGRGEGGDVALVIDRAAEDAVIAELEALDVPLDVISEERGEVRLHGGGEVRAVIDPVDGSLNSKRGLPFASVSIAVASGPTSADLELGYVATLDAAASEWWAVAGGPAFRDDERLPPLEPGGLEVLGLETARPELVAGAAPALATLGARRLRAFGSVAASLCLVADGRLDAMVSLRPVRSVDVAAGIVLVRSAGGAIALPEAGPRAALDLGMRSRIAAARDETTLDRVLAAFAPAIT